MSKKSNHNPPAGRLFSNEEIDDMAREAREYLRRGGRRRKFKTVDAMLRSLRRSGAV